MTFEKRKAEYEAELKKFVFRLANVDLRAMVYDILTKDYPADTEDTLRKYKRNLYMCRYGIMYMKQRNMYNEYRANKQTDSLLCALLLHNLFFDGRKENWKDVFTARSVLGEIAKQYTSQENVGAIEYMWTIIEAQLGEDMPIPACRPVPGQIASTAYEIIWFYNHPAAEMADEIQKNKEQFLKNVYPILNPDDAECKEQA